MYMHMTSSIEYLNLARWVELGSQGLSLEEAAFHSQMKGAVLHQGPMDQTETRNLCK